MSAPQRECVKLNIKVREIMKGKLYETLIGTDARLAITISGEELKEFIEDVMADARLRAESEIKAKQSEECIDKEEVKRLLRVCDTTLWKWAKRGKPGNHENADY